jgi:hypothetical protein
MTWLIYFQPSFHRAHTDHIATWIGDSCQVFQLASTDTRTAAIASMCSTTLVVIDSSSVSLSKCGFLIWCARCNTPLDKTGPNISPHIRNIYLIAQMRKCDKSYSQLITEPRSISNADKVLLATWPWYNRTHHFSCARNKESRASDKDTQAISSSASDGSSSIL